MEQSSFLTYIKKFFTAIVVSIVKKLNDSNKTELRYRFKEMLTPKFSVTGKWESLRGDYSNVAADYVAMDSPLPLKKRDSVGVAYGDIPKSGMRLYLNETQMTNIQTMQQLGTNISQVAAALFEDSAKVIKGIYENNERAFLQGLSTGVASIPDEDNVGSAIRVDYGYLTKNKFGVSVLWTNPSTAKPLNDIERLLEQARVDANVPRVVLIDRKTLNLMGATDQVRAQWAFFKDMALTSTSLVPKLTLEKVNEYMQSEYNLTFDIIERAVKVEKDGTRKVINPWQEGMVIFLPDYNVGDLVYANTAEANSPVPGVSYETADGYILVSKYRKNEPAVSEWTASQARVVPVISNVDQIYQLDTKTIQA